MLPVDPVYSTSSTDRGIPWPLNVQSTRYWPGTVGTAKHKNLFCALSLTLCQPRKSGTKGGRRSGRGFLHIQRPIKIHGIADINTQSCKLILLFLGPRAVSPAQPQPVAGK